MSDISEWLQNAAGALGFAGAVATGVTTGLEAAGQEEGGGFFVGVSEALAGFRTQLAAQSTPSGAGPINAPAGNMT